MYYLHYGNTKYEKIFKGNHQKISIDKSTKKNGEKIPTDRKLRNP